MTWRAFFGVGDFAAAFFRVVGCVGVFVFSGSLRPDPLPLDPVWTVFLWWVSVAAAAGLTLKTKTAARTAAGMTDVLRTKAIIRRPKGGRQGKKANRLRYLC